MLSVLDLSIDDDLKRLRTFSELDHPPSFRYFKNRVFEDAIKTHVVTLMYSTYGYAHVDLDAKSGRHYLGICVLPEYQGKGVGKRLLNLLLKLYTGDIYLTVDKDNARAISLYETYEFVRIQESETTYTYKKPGMTLMEVSVGEAFDKLTILDIKMQKIRDPVKKAHCKREYDAVSAVVGLKHARFYNWLKYINLRIWDLQDEMREGNRYSEKGFRDILDLNDMRFRVKKRINDLVNSSFQEQKGYSSKAGLFLTHLGLGDLINMNGAIRFAALMVDKLYVICKSRNIKNVKEMFSDDPSITIVECADDDSNVREVVSRLPNITRTFLSGVWGGKHVDTTTDITLQSYDHLGFPREVKQAFAYLHSNSPLDPPDIPYVFTHSSSSYGTQLNFGSRLNTDEILTIDPNHNVYAPGHKWHDLAQRYINLPILSYLKVIENAQEIHVSDSSFYCLSCFVPSRATKKVCYDRSSGAVLRQYRFT